MNFGLVFIKWKSIPNSEKSPASISETSRPYLYHVYQYLTMDPEEYKEYYDAVYKRNILRARYGEEAHGKTTSQYSRMFGFVRGINIVKVVRVKM
ncbi:Bifunctional purine biosynthesis protein PurH [Trichinella pseudospiralis]